jgi:FkbM family methyltransferase
MEPNKIDKSSAESISKRNDLCNSTFLGSNELGRILHSISMTCLDVGARGGFKDELISIAPSVNAIGFEPEAIECQRLNAKLSSESQPWKSIKFLPVALGEKAENRILNIYNRRGCTSLLEADIEQTSLFFRPDYYELIDTASIDTMPMDQAAQQYGFQDAVYLKIDVEGAELEVFSTAKKLLAESLNFIRMEVTFAPIRKKQPLFSDIESFLRPFGFVPLGFVEMHHWRPLSKVKHPYLADNHLPYSKGQMIHGDVLFWKPMPWSNQSNINDISAMMRIIFLLLVHEYVDHAYQIVCQDNIARLIDDAYNINIKHEIELVSRFLAKQNRRAQFNLLIRNLKDLLLRRV